MINCAGGSSLGRMAPFNCQDESTVWGCASGSGIDGRYLASAHAWLGRLKDRKLRQGLSFNP